ncbi:MAG: hypothetical protein FWH35_10460 [Treponema sp.]|nr:hypothetical protein [Treponema sp.]
MDDKVECILKHKNRDVLSFMLLKDSWNIETVTVHDADFSPINAKNTSNIQAQDLKKWLENRCIPNSRDGIERLKGVHGIDNPVDLMVAQKGLSLSDNYWIDKVPFNTRWENINYFDNDYNNKFANVVFDTHFRITTNKEDSPNTALNGAQRKSWLRENGHDYIIKAGFERTIQEPFNEYYASMVLDVLAFKHIKYDLSEMNKQFVSKCECYTNKDREFINGNDIRLKYGIKKDLKSIMELCDQKSLMNIKEKFDEMFIIDYLIDNTDRHWNNFGIIRDAGTGEWIEFMPLFDHGISVWSTRQKIDASEPSRSGFWVEGNVSNADNIKNIDLGNYVNNTMIYNLSQIFDKAFEYYPIKNRKEELRKGIKDKERIVGKVLEGCR